MVHLLNSPRSPPVAKYRRGCRTEFRVAQRVVEVNRRPACDIRPIRPARAAGFIIS